MDEVPKILPNGQVTYEPGREPDGVALPPAVVSIEVTGADEVLAVIDEAKAALDELAATQATPAGDAPAQDAAPAPEPAVPPRVPPRRVLPGGGDG